ncbi:hypothetical protein BC830DRAFT_1067025 [Chytriomyces sp. MP71]|nr:hypothetical protein BC830DRAFT_1067025 [Chytriomyces sp. MP71]
MKRTLSAPEINSTKSTAGPALRKRYACEFAGCGRTFDHKSNFLEHRRTHTGERPFACDFPGCTKDYTTRNRLTVHKRDHTGERPFKCTYTNCDFATTQSSNLKKHRLTHMTPDEKRALEKSKEYECTECGKKYGNPRGFKQHMMTVHKVAL